MSDNWSFPNLERDLALIQGVLIAAATTAGLVLGVIVNTAWRHAKRPGNQT